MGAGDSRGYTISQTFSTGAATYAPPVAHTQLVDGQTNVSASITLTATDSNSPPQSLTFATWSIPRNGKLYLSNGVQVTLNHNYTLVPGGTLSYVPNEGYYGDDSFTFVACNEFACSTPVTVAILLVPLAPSATAQSVNVYPARETTPITLAGTDPNSPVLPIVSYTVTTLPTLGTLSGTAPSLSYTRNAVPGAGNDSFQFVVSNGGTTSSPATVALPWV